MTAPHQKEYAKATEHTKRIAKTLNATFERKQKNEKKYFQHYERRGISKDC